MCTRVSGNVHCWCVVLVYYVPDVGDTSIPFNEHMPELVNAVDHAKREKARWADSITKF